MTWLRCELAEEQTNFFIRKSVFNVFYQVRHKLTCAATKASLTLEILDLEILEIVFSTWYKVKNKGIEVQLICALVFPGTQY